MIINSNKNTHSLSIKNSDFGFMLMNSTLFKLLISYILNLKLIKNKLDKGSTQIVYLRQNLRI